MKKFFLKVVHFMRTHNLNIGMIFTNVCTSRLCGYKIGNADLDDNAGIAVTKIGTRTKRVNLGFGDYTDAVASADGVFPVLLLPDASTKNLYKSLPLPADWDSGDLKFCLVWKTTATTNNAKFYLTGRSSPADGSADTTSEFTANVVSTAYGTTVKYKTAEITIPAANVAAGDILGIRVYRDPADAGDTLATDLYVLNTYLEYTARC